MALLHLLFSCIGKCIDLICFLLDLNFVIVNTLVRLLVALLSLVNSLPMLLTTSLSECANLTLFYMITVVEGVTVVTHNVIGGWVQLMGGMLESCKMVGYLSVHLLLRTKELLQRGLLSGQGLLRQAVDACGIVVSLLLYFINTLVNLLLIGTQNLYAVVLSMAEAVASPFQKAIELTLTVLTFFYSCLVGTSLLLWTPCRLAVEFLSSLGHLLISVFLLNSYGLLITVIIISSATFYLNPVLMQTAAQKISNLVNSVPSLQRLQRIMQRMGLLERRLWQRMAWARSRLHLWMLSRRTLAFRTRHDDVQQINTEQDPPEEAMRPEVHNDNLIEEPPQAPNLIDLTLPSSSTDRPLQKGLSEDSCKAAPPENLLTLLHEQEERKKCVICQDSSKSVVLLPCRHLCLCKDCTNILLRQPIYQQNCPLCRHMILQTMDVYL